ncbi:replication protein DnaD [Lactobacillus plantarum] [Lactiplantibacillus mudanjiangensis]|uniref:DnaD domain protein n=1 Tax=Lactiplantibacillus mudanjiangensis TaxID=1296538 RepID=UPI0010145305|nr:replication protein DnaD [Lactobacillus plantarum] [Lactiplantibacillus mudanjiangensis]
MDYFKQRRAYRKLKRDQIDISIGQNNLYRELLDYANDEYQLDNLFTLKNSAVLDLTGMSEAGLKKARNELVQLGLIDYVPGKRNKQKPKYQIKLLYGTSWATKTEKSSSTSTPTSSSTGSPGSSSTSSSKELTITVPDPTGTEPYDDDVTRENVFNKWQSLWGFPNAVARPEIDVWLSEFKPEVIEFAIQIAGEHDVQPRGAFNYMRAVIDGWKKRKIVTLEQAKKAAAEHDQRTSNHQKPMRAGGTGRKEIVPGWVNTDDDVPPKKASEAEVDRKALADRIAGLDAKRTEN